MGLLYADANGGYTDPASSGLKYMRADGQWANPDMSYRFLDAMGGWSVPELGPFVPPEDIADASWREIEKLSALAAESPQDYTKYLGQTKVVDMSAFSRFVGDVTVMVIGVGHDEGPSGETRGLTFQLRDGLYRSGFYMNDTDTGDGGWRDSTMRTKRLPELKAAMPEDLRKRLKVMVKRTYITDAQDELVETQDDLALLSVSEVLGDGWAFSESDAEGRRYQWYADHDTDESRVIHGSGGSTESWWMRSVRENLFAYMPADGRGLGSTRATNNMLPCACFCV